MTLDYIDQLSTSWLEQIKYSQCNKLHSLQLQPSSSCVSVLKRYNLLHLCVRLLYNYVHMCPSVCVSTYILHVCVSVLK